MQTLVRGKPDVPKTCHAVNPSRITTTEIQTKAMNMSDGKIVIKRGREKPIRQQHPWIFSGAIDEVKGNPTPGDIVTVVDGSGHFLARGYWNPKSQIQVRILSWQDEPIDEAWWRRMLRRAVDRRQYFDNLIESNTLLPGCRLVNAENDYIPGLIVDKYAYWIVVQALTLAIDQRKIMIGEILAEILENPVHHYKVKGIFERSDVDVRGKEGLKPVVGTLLGEEPPQEMPIPEGSLQTFLVDVRKGHKTGMYLDQRDNRFLLGQLLDQHNRTDRRVLNLFSYTGGFGLHAMHGRASSIINVDSSAEALQTAERMFQINDRGDEAVQAEFIQADVFEFLRDQAAEGQQYDVVICDPPKFAHNAGQVEKAARGYKDINLNAFKCVKEGGYLMTFSCSGAISADLFQKIVFGALADSGRQAQILKHLGPGDDHPVALTFPEGAYLKGLLLRVY